MAGATNAWAKAQGWKAADVTRARAEHGAISHELMARSFTPKKYSHAHKAIGAEKAKVKAAADAKQQGDVRRSLQSVTARMLAARKDAAAKKASSAKATVAPAKKQARSGLLRLPLAKKLNLDVRVTKNVMAEFISPSIYRRESRRERMSTMVHALSSAVRNNKGPSNVVRFSVNSRAEGGIQGIGRNATFGFKARLMPKKGKDGKSLVVINLVKNPGQAIKGRAESRKLSLDSAVSSGVGVKRDANRALRVESRGDIVPFKHNGKEMFAAHKGGRTTRVLHRDGTTVRNPAAIRRGARVVKAVMARASAKTQAPALQRRAAAIEAKKSAAATAAKRLAAQTTKNRVQPFVRESGGKILSLHGNFSHKGKHFSLEKKVIGEKLVTSIRPREGGYVSKPSKALAARAERVAKAIEKRHKAGGRGISYHNVSYHGV